MAEPGEPGELGAQIRGTLVAPGALTRRASIGEEREAPGAQGKI